MKLDKYDLIEILTPFSVSLDYASNNGDDFGKKLNQIRV